MTDATSSGEIAPRRLLGVDGWAVLAALILTALVWADLLPAIRW